MAQSQQTHKKSHLQIHVFILRLSHKLVGFWLLAVVEFFSIVQRMILATSQNYMLRYGKNPGLFLHLAFCAPQAQQ